MTRQQYYPAADKDKQNFFKQYPALFGASRWMSDVKTLVIHTTEVLAWPGYSAGSMCPTFTYDPRTHEMRQHIPVNMAARALVDAAGGVVTDRYNCAQIEIIGYANQGGPLDDRAVQDLGALVAWLHKEWGMPLQAPYSFAYPAHRLTFNEWNNFSGGLLGHCHVPENDHVDPGNIRVKDILAAATQTNSPIEHLEEDMLPIIMATTGEVDPATGQPWTPIYSIVPGQYPHHLSPQEWALLKRAVPGLTEPTDRFLKAEVDILAVALGAGSTPPVTVTNNASTVDLQPIISGVISEIKNLRLT